jgi:hypothetical protein
VATFSFLILSCIGSFCRSKEEIGKWGFVCCPQMSGHYVQCQLLVNLVLFSCHLSLHCWWREYWEGLPIGIGFSSGIDPWLFLVVRDTNYQKKFMLLPVKASMFLQLQSPPALCLQWCCIRLYIWWSREEERFRKNAFEVQESLQIIHSCNGKSLENVWFSSGVQDVE